MLRRLTAIMFTDIAGYSALMAASETKALYLLKLNRNIQRSLIEKHNGHWIKEMGDGIMANFDHARDAVRCAIEIQKESQDLDAKIRIGIHWGEVNIDGNDLFGHGVNIASRIEAIADPGGIYITQAVLSASEAPQEFQSKFLGELLLKNIPDRVRTYAIVGEPLPIPNPKKISQLISKPGLTSLAVLPFRSLGQNEEEQYLVDGIQDALIGELSQIESLRVISRTSTMRYRDTSKAVPQIAQELGVDGLIEGTLLQYSESAHLHVKLIRAFPKEEHVWAASYRKELKDLFALYSEVVKDITKHLKANLTPQEQTHLNNPHLVVPEAYEAYLKGLFHWEKLTKDDLETAQGYFEKSKEIDPGFAPAHSGLAAIWMGRLIMGYTRPHDAVTKIYTHIRQTRKLDEHHADSHFWDALISVWIEWDWAGGVNAFEKVLSINSNHSLASAYYSHLLLFLENGAESDYQMKRAVELDPFNPLIQSLYSMQLNYSRKYDQAADVAIRILKEQKNHPVALSTLRSIFHNKKMYHEAYSIFKKSFENAGDYEVSAALETGFKNGGYTRSLVKAAEIFIDRSHSHSENTWQIATLYTRAGNKEPALHYLEKALQIRESNLPYISIDPIFDDLRNEARFKRILSSMNLVVQPG
jgi:adenylate cyclase